MTTKQLPILQILSVSNQYERHVIVNQDDQTWNGEKFNDEQPLLYADFRAACKDSADILRGHFPGVTPVRYVVPIFVEVYSHEPIDVNMVAQHLSQSTRLQINTDTHGNGPGNSLVLPWIPWHRIEQVKELPDD